eukprot:4393628-Pleurochrysis_carterae.AAC.1
MARKDTQSRLGENKPSDAVVASKCRASQRQIHVVGGHRCRNAFRHRHQHGRGGQRSREQHAHRHGQRNNPPQAPLRRRSTASHRQRRCSDATPEEPAGVGQRVSQSGEPGKVGDGGTRGTASASHDRQSIPHTPNRGNDPP